MDYWKECISEAFCDAGISATNEQIEMVVGFVEGAHDNYGTYTGSEHIPNPMVSEVEALRIELERQKNEYDTMLRGVRKGVAFRRGVDVHSVGIDKDGLVTYGH